MWKRRHVDPKKLAEHLLQNGESIDTVIERLRALGLEKIDTIKILRQVTHLSLTEAKAAVHGSPAWADRRDADDRFHEKLIDAALRWADEEHQPNG